MEKFHIEDWAGNILFHHLTFDSFYEGWGHIYSNVSNQGDEHTYDDYFVLPCEDTE